MPSGLVTTNSAANEYNARVRNQIVSLIQWWHNNNPRPNILNQIMVGNSVPTAAGGSIAGNNTLITAQSLISYFNQLINRNGQTRRLTYHYRKIRDRRDSKGNVIQNIVEIDDQRTGGSQLTSNYHINVAYSDIGSPAGTIIDTPNWDSLLANWRNVYYNTAYWSKEERYYWTDYSQRGRR